MAHIISCASQKGGTGKTTTAMNLGAALALNGLSVLLVDSDSQGSLTLGLGHTPSDLEKILYEAYMDEVKLKDTILETGVENMFLVPSNNQLANVQLQLSAEYCREFFLAEILQSGDGFDFVLIDCPPSLGLLTVNALTASNSFIAVMEAEFFGLSGLYQLLSAVDKMSRLNRELHLLGILPTMILRNRRIDRQVLKVVRKEFPNRVFSPIYQCVKLAESPAEGKTIFDFAPNSQAAKDYRKLAKDIIKMEDN